MPSGLAELHLHLYGCIRARDYLNFVATRDVDWDWYEDGIEKAYGSRVSVGDVIARHLADDAGAAAAFEELFVFGDADAGNFARFQAKFNLLIAGSNFRPVLLGDFGLVDALVDEVRFFLAAIRENNVQEGVRYAEQRLLLGDTLDTDPQRAVLDAVLSRYADDSSPDIVERLAVRSPCRDPWPAWCRVQELALGATGETLTGIDFCHVEEGFAPKDKAELFAAVREFNDEHPDRGVAILYHVGESFTDKSLESAVRWVQEAAELGAHRLGHAIALGVDPACLGPHRRTEGVGERLDQIAYDLAHAEGLSRYGVVVDRAALEAECRRLRDEPSDALVTHVYDDARLDGVRRRQDFAMDRVRSTGAVIEVCPTSNRRIGAIADIAHHPVHRFAARGLPFVVASDDPGIFGTTLADELDWVAAALGLDAAARDDLAQEAWRYRSEVLTGRESA